MKYKAKRGRSYKQTRNYIPLTGFIREVPLPKEAMEFLWGSEYVATGKCKVCGKETLALYRREEHPLPLHFFVCTNPNCKAYGVVEVK